MTAAVPADPRVPARHLIAVTLVAVVAALVGLTARATTGARTTADEPYYLLTAESLLDDGDLDISDQLDARAYEPYHEIAVDPQTTPLDAEGRRVSPHDPLLPLLLVPGVAVGRAVGDALGAGPTAGGWVGAKALLALLAGLTAAATLRLAVRRFGVAPHPAALAVGAAAAGLPLAAYGTQVYPELPAALAVVLAVDAIAGLPATADRRRLLPPLLGLCAAVVALPWLSVKYAPVAAVLALLGAVRSWQAGARREVVVAGCGLAVAGIAYLGLHQALYGGWTAYAAGDHFVDTGELSVVGTAPNHLGRARRLVGLIVDSRFGLATWAPIWFAIPAAAVVAWRGPVDRRWLLLAPVAAGWGTATFVALTMHGWWVPGRQVVVVLPLLAVAIGVLLDRLPRLRLAAWLAAVAGASSWVWLAIESSAGARTLVVHLTETAAPAYRLLAAVTPDGIARRPVDDVLLVAWGLLLVGSAVWTARRLPAAPSPSPVPPAPADSGPTHSPTSRSEVRT